MVQSPRLLYDEVAIVASKVVEDDWDVAVGEVVDVAAVVGCAPELSRDVVVVAHLLVGFAFAEGLMADVAERSLLVCSLVFLRQSHRCVPFQLLDALLRQPHELAQHVSQTIFPEEGSQRVAGAVKGADEIITAAVDDVLVQEFRVPLNSAQLSQRRLAVCVYYEGSSEFVLEVLEGHEGVGRRQLRHPLLEVLVIADLQMPLPLLFGVELFAVGAELLVLVPRLGGLVQKP